MEIYNAWVAVNADTAIVTKKLRVPGGWIVHMEDASSTDTCAAFVSDPQHEWVPIATSSEA